MLCMFAGDTHGDYRHFSYLISICIQHDIHTIFVLGDFGYWEHESNGFLFLKVLDESLEQAGITLYWLDGNHENHPKLWEKYGSERDRFIPIRNRIFYSPRGHRWEWNGVRFLSLGGAHSIDKDWREAGTEWWPTETITEEDVQACGTDPVDVLLSHDVGMDVDLNLEFAIKRRGFFKADTNTLINRHRLQTVIEATDPRYVLHGHYHLRYDQKVHNRKYTGLDCNGTQKDSFMICNLKDFT